MCWQSTDEKLYHYFLNVGPVYRDGKNTRSETRNFGYTESDFLDLDLGNTDLKPDLKPKIRSKSETRKYPNINVYKFIIIDN